MAEAADSLRAEERDEELLDRPDALTHVLDECRMVLPGIQALFGFQMVAVFNSSFNERLSGGQRQVHLLAIVLVVVAIGLVMAPASLHRQAEPRTVSDQFLMVATRLMLTAMLPLAAGICFDVYLVAAVICGDSRLAIALATSLFIFFVVLWFAYPSLYRIRRRRIGNAHRTRRQEPYA